MTVGGPPTREAAGVVVVCHAACQGAERLELPVMQLRLELASPRFRFDLPAVTANVPIRPRGALENREISFGLRARAA
jgi:hypothetical protein